MKTDLFIPKTIVVGCQKRSDTYLGELGYIIYRDNKNVLRKEKSWQNWRDQTIEPREFTNEPTNGFTFNKGVQRYGDWNSTGRSLVRVFDPRGYEFEVSIENLIGLLMHSDVSKRDIVQDCVYAWYGTELILLPTNSEVYQESLKHTEKQDMKVGAKELGIGYTYELKKDRQHVVYLGRFDAYDMVRHYDDPENTMITRTQKKKKAQHVFFNLQHNSIEFKSPTQYLARVVSEECHLNYAEYMQQFYKLYSSQPIVKLVTKCDEYLANNAEGDKDFELDHRYNYYTENNKGYYLAYHTVQKITGSRYTQVGENQFVKLEIQLSLYDHYKHGSPVAVGINYHSVAIYDPEARTLRQSKPESGSHGWSYTPAKELAELGYKSEIVQSKIAEVRRDLEAATAGWLVQKTGEVPIAPELQQVLKNLAAVAHKHALGYMYGVLTDGHVSNDYIY